MDTIVLRGNDETCEGGGNLRVCSDKERFEAKIEMIPESGCWIWTAAVDKDGYGWFKYNGKNMGAHRSAWLIYRGPIPEGVQVLHRCDTPCCVNPDHEFLGTNGDNMKDKAQKGRAFHTFGEINGMSKLCESDVLEIRASCEKQKDLAKRKGVSEALVSLIKSNKVWSHI